MLVTFLPMNQKIEASIGDNLLFLAQELGIDLDGACNGNGTCGKCKVMVTKGNYPLHQKEELYLTLEEKKAGKRLACYFQIKEDTCVIVEKKRPKSTSKEIFSAREEDRNCLGISFDIGTTTMEAKLYDLESKSLLLQVARENPQVVYGADVISRIQYSNQSKDHFKKMHELLLRGCMELIQDMKKKLFFSDETVKKVVAVGNTTMSNYLTLDFSLEGKVHLSKSLPVPVIVPHNIGGHVGSDTLGCILATKIHQRDGIYLVVDVGTNGEIVLAKEKHLVTCSTAAGPAFEGASISQGMKAFEGAISQVQMIDGEMQLKVIGDVTPKGICGSGLIDVAAELLRHGMMDLTGRLQKTVILSRDKTGREVAVNQKDIRELQLAKAAIYAGIQMVLKKEEVTVDRIDGLYLAGAFGTHMNLDNGKYIGLLPDIPEHKIHLIGNGALDGASRILFEEVSIEVANELASKINHIELANQQEFADIYIESINFS